jgi:hypothetical protein
MKVFDVICLGEVLVDLISQEPGKKLADVALFKKLAVVRRPMSRSAGALGM